MPFPLLAAAIPAAIGAIGSIWGAKSANDANKKLAQQQTDFQQRMSDTAVSRSVKDYGNAGLNPALAYDRSASSPSGVSATMGNETGGLESAVSGARAYHMAAKQMQIAQTQSEADKRVKDAQEKAINAQNHRDTSAALLSDQQRNLAIQQHSFNLEQQPQLLRQIKAQATQQELGIPAMRNAASWEEFISGKPNLGLKGLGEALKNIQLFRR